MASLGYYVRHLGVRRHFAYVGFAVDFANRVDADAIWHEDGTLYQRRW